MTGVQTCALPILRTEMVYKAGITGNVLGRLAKNQPISMGSLEKICKLLHCSIGDIVEFVEDESYDYIETKK